MVPGPALDRVRARLQVESGSGSEQGLEQVPGSVQVQIQTEDRVHLQVQVRDRVWTFC